VKCPRNRVDEDVMKMLPWGAGGGGYAIVRPTRVSRDATEIVRWPDGLGLYQPRYG
jgi:hypothetical protein